MSGHAQLDRIEARAAIADLVHGYALAVRRNRPEDVERLFAPGGTFEIRDGAPDSAGFTLRERFDSPQALVSYLVSRKGSPHPIPLIHNLMIELGGDTACASSVMVGPILNSSHATLGEYADTFVRHNDIWLFATRTFTIFR